MKIVFVNRYYAPDQSATSRMLTDLAAALADRYRIYIVTSRLRSDDTTAVLAAHEIDGNVEVHRVWTTRFGRANLAGRTLDYLTFYVTALMTLIRLIRRGDLIVAKTDPPLISVPASWAARIRGARLVNWIQDLFPEVASELGVAIARGALGRVLGRLRVGSLRYAVANVVLGTRMSERVAALGVDARKIAVIPNWADGTALKPAAQGANPLRATWGLGSAFVVGYSGNLGRVHDFETLLAAARELRSETATAFLLIGDGAQKADLVRIIDDGLPNVVLKPFQPSERLAESLAVADAHIVTLRPELEGLVVPSKFYGVAAVGRPTIYIGDPNGEIGSIVREAECGICVEQGDVPGLVAAVAKLRDDPPLRERMGRNARRVFEERFDLPIAVAAWRSLLRSLAGGPETSDQRRRKSA